MKKTELSSDNFMVTDTQPGDRLLVGGTLWGDEFMLETDWDNLENVDAWIEKTLQDNDPQKIIDFFEARNEKVSSLLGAATWRAQNMLELGFSKNITEDQNARMDSYQEACHDGRGAQKLSDMIRGQHMACTEISLVAARMIEKQGLIAHVVVGSWVHKDTPAVCDPHSYVIVEDPETSRVALYDPSNYVQGEHYQLPSVMDVPRSLFEAWLAKAEKTRAFMELENTFSGSKRIYGAAYHVSSFSPETDLVKPGEAAPSPEPTTQ